MNSSDEKIAKFLEELRMPSLLVQPQYGTFNPTGTAQMQIYSILRTAILCIRNSDTAARTFNVTLQRKSRCGSHVSKITFFLLCAFSLQKHLAKFRAKLEKSHSDLRFFVQSFGRNLVQLLGNFHPNFASFQAQWVWPYRTRNTNTQTPK